MTGTERRSSYTPEQLRAIIYRQRPYIFNGLRSTLADLQSIARTYAALQYEVTLNALNSIAKLLEGYLRVRDGDLMMPSSINAMAGPTEFEFDSVLTEAMEGISALHKAAIRGGDVQLSQQIIDALEYLALQSVNIRSLFSRPDENPTTAFVRAYMFGPVQEGAVRGLDDITMNGARAQTNIAKALLRQRQYLTARTAIDDLEKLAFLGVAQRKSHVIGTPVRGIAEILQVAVSEGYSGGHITRSALLALKRICVAELQFESSPLDQSLRFALGPFLDATQPSALPNIEAAAIQGLSSALQEGNLPKVDEYRDAIRQLNDHLWEILAGIGTAGAKTKSFVIFYVNANIADIAKQCFWLLDLLNRTKPEAVDEASAHNRWLTEKFADEILRDLNWIVGATYWRIFNALKPPVDTNAVWDFFPTLSHIGIQALDAQLPSVAEAAITELKSMSLKAIESASSPYDAPRIATFIARIGIIAQKLKQTEILNLSVTALNEFQKAYLAMQQKMQPGANEYEATLLNELEGLKLELDKRQWFLDEEDASFFGRIRPMDIDDFVARLEVPHA